MEKKFKRIRLPLFFYLLIFCFVFLSLSYARNKFGFPEAVDYIAIIADQLPSLMTNPQLRFAATHYIGSQKLTLDISKRLRRYNPNFIVLHYHLAIWQQQPAHKFIIDGRHWGNDWPFVSKHENWFWHNEKGLRIRSRIDGKYLMNIANLDFRKYWKRSIARQLLAGEYQGVFLDSASPALLPWEAAHADPRLAHTAACNRPFKELGGLTWCKAYEIFMKDLTSFLESLGFATLPNVGALFTSWDETDYYTSASGAFMEGAFDTQSTADWLLAMKRTLRFIKNDKIVIFQSYLNKDSDYKKRLYLLACYLLIKGKYSYLNYFHKTPLSWYPEWEIDLGSPEKLRIDSIKSLEKKGLYRRLYEKGEVFVNASSRYQKVEFKKDVYKVLPEGGGPVNKKGVVFGKLKYQKMNHLKLGPWEGLIVLYKMPEEKEGNDE